MNEGHIAGQFARIEPRAAAANFLHDGDRLAIYQCCSRRLETFRRLGDPAEGVRQLLDADAAENIGGRGDDRRGPQTAGNSAGEGVGSALMAGQ